MKPSTLYHRQAMSEEQLQALLANLKDDAGLQEKFKGAADLDAAIALAKEAGFDVSKADWLKYQAKQTLELSDEELEGVAGGIFVCDFIYNADTVVVDMTKSGHID
jgi:predicted ribosomally synthesized peptide with nif11-like leader